MFGLLYMEPLATDKLFVGHCDVNASEIVQRRIKSQRLSFHLYTLS